MSLSVLIPVHNSAPYIKETLDSLYDSLMYAGLSKSELIVLDDGSTDDTFKIIENYKYAVDDLRPKIYSQVNRGRFLSRVRLAKMASNEKIVFCDSRLKIDLKSFAALTQTIESNPQSSIIGGISFASGLPLVSYFWQCLEKLAWREYEKTPVQTTIDFKNFNKIPKGTTLVLVSRNSFLETSEKLSEVFYSDPHANDDTLLFREIVKNEMLIKEPSFSAQYIPRIQFNKFLMHAYHRGKVIDKGYFHPESRSRFGLYSLLVLFCVILTMLFVNFTYFIFFVFFILCSVTCFVLFQTFIPLKSRISFVVYFIPFTLFFGSGIFMNAYNNLFKKRNVRNR